MLGGSFFHVIRSVNSLTEQVEKNARLLIPACHRTTPDEVPGLCWLCPGTGGNIHCRKDSPCSTRTRGNRYPRPARLCLRAAAPPEDPAPRPPDDTRLSLAFCAENAAFALRAPSMSHCPALAPPAVKDSFNTILNSSILYRHCMSGTAASGRRAEQEIRTP